jgi:uncharacterized protein (TIGR02271 family)
VADADDVRADGGEAELVLHEERLDLDRRLRAAGVVRASVEQTVDHHVEQVPVTVEVVAVEHRPPLDDDDGQVHTEADGSVSVPVLAEEVVVTTRWVVRERVVLRKARVTETREVAADLRSEHVRVERERS